MPTLIRFSGGGGSSRNYIFKDGEFKIQPTQSNMQIVNGTLTNGYYLDIPYNHANEIVYFSFETLTGSGTDCNMKISTTDAPQTNGNGIIGDTGIRNINTAFTLLMGIPSGSRISYCCASNFKSRFIIKSIWTEKAS